MKTTKKHFGITLGLFLLTTVIAFANNTDPIVKNKKSTTAEVVKPIKPLELNKEYVSMVNQNSSLEVEKYLSGIIAEWDVLNSAKFDSRKSEFKVVFRSGNGFANVFYDNEGRIIKVNKYLKNVKVPIEILQLVSEKYGDWTVVQNKYDVSYKNGNDVVKSYVLTLQNGTKKKKFRIKA